MSYPNWLTPQLLYVISSGVVAILIWIETMMLKKNGGKLPKSAFFQLSSLIDTVWFFVSVAVLYLVDFAPIAVTVPAAYGLYTVFGWIYGSKLLRKKGLPDSPKDLIVPNKYIAYSQSFAQVFFVLCIIVVTVVLNPSLSL